MEGFSAGEPGDPQDLSRIIQVSMEERDGKMLYVPAQVEIRKGETIKFVIFNDGELEHEFVLARLHQLNAIFAIFGASDRDKSLDLKGRGLRNRL